MQKRSFILLAFLGLILLSGCSNNLEVGKEAAEYGTGILNIELTLPGDSIGQASLQSVTNQITIDKIEAEICYLETDERQWQDVNDLSSGPVNISFPSLKPGRYELVVLAREADNGTYYDVYRGGPVITSVAVDSVTNVKVNMELVPADVTVQVINNSSLAVATANISLYNPVLETRAGDITLGDNNSISFTGLKASNWQLKAVLRDASDNILAQWEDDILLLPGRDNQVIININDGSISITTQWEEAPGAPNNFTVQQIDDSVYLSWGASYHAETYAIYRSDSRYGDKVLIASNILNTYYIDNGVSPGTYWYWVRAFDANGLASDYSVGQKITVIDE